VLTVLLAVRGGKWAAFEAGLEVARQNGKGGVYEARELAGLFLLGERLLVHSRTSRRPPTRRSTAWKR
jgi:hypothetical protein